ncbi:MAG: hypothetical protein JSV22_05550 [Bacteroidales bacterium]|nr:MAG: hypothetical protein JSV22_05550 [Bacteroidales bacterium]
MNNTIVHIGYPKTGTTWFQKEFFPKVRDYEFFSPLTMRKLFGERISKISPEAVKNKLVRNRKNVIISDESMIGGFKKIRHNALQYRKAFNSATIIVFIRNQFELLMSAYSQYIKEGGEKRINDFLFIEDKNSLYGGKKYLYDSTIQIYQEIFGEENVHVYLFEDFRLNPRLFIERFCKRYNFQINIDKLNFSRKNKKLSGFLLSVKRYSNYLTKKQPPWINSAIVKKKYLVHIPFWNGFTQRLFELNNSIDGIGREIQYKDIISERNLKIIKDYFADSNQYLVEKKDLREIIRYNYPL